MCGASERFFLRVLGDITAVKKIIRPIRQQRLGTLSICQKRLLSKGQKAKEEAIRATDAVVMKILSERSADVLSCCNKLFGFIMLPLRLRG